MLPCLLPTARSTCRRVVLVMVSSRNVDLKFGEKEKLRQESCFVHHLAQVQVKVRNR